MFFQYSGKLIEVRVTEEGANAIIHIDGSGKGFFAAESLDVDFDVGFIKKLDADSIIVVFDNDVSVKVGLGYSSCPNMM